MRAGRDVQELPEAPVRTPIITPYSNEMSENAHRSAWTVGEQRCLLACESWKFDELVLDHVAGGPLDSH